MRTLWIALLVQGVGLAAGSGQDTLPLFFISNQGQAPPAVRFMAKGSGLTAYFLTEEVVLRGPAGAIRMRFDGARSGVVVEGRDMLAGRANFLTGAEAQWRVGVPLFGKVAYRGLYPGIDMVYGGEGRNLKSEYVVAPGSDPSRIAVRYLGAGRPRVGPDGSLTIPGEGVPLREEAPKIYQIREGKQVGVHGQFTVAEDGSVGFQVGLYDATRPLIIDPVLSYSTLLGGSGFDTATAVAVDSTGAAYVAGYTDSTNLPTSNPEQSHNAGGNDAFIAKLNAAGNGLAYCTYLGGSGDDRAFALAVDAVGSAYVTGWTGSFNFPMRNALQSRLQGARNVFVAKLSPAGNSLVFSTYLGGNGVDSGNGIALDGSLNVYVAGDTTSLNFPATTLQKGFRGGQDAFVVKLSADGGRVVYSTYLGGTSTDHGAGIAVDGGGSAYVTGSTYSTDFPTANAAQRNLAGGVDAFVARLSSDGSSLTFSTYLGGTGGTTSYPEGGQGIALDNQGSAYVVGVTSSSDFPTLHPWQSARGGSMDAFVSKLNAAGALMYSTYLGGSGIEVGNGITVDGSGGAYVVGYSYSTDLPLTGALQNQLGGDCDGFLAKLSTAGDSLVYLSYMGGGSSDTATSVALDPAGNAYVAGWTLSTNFPLLNPYQSTNSGNYGSFVMKVVFAQPPALVGVWPNSGSGPSQTFSFQFSDSNGATNLTTVSALFNSAVNASWGCEVVYDRTKNTLALLTDLGAQPSGTIVPGSGSQQNSQCILSGAGSSVSLAGQVLTLNVSLTFLPAFSIATNIYMQAVNSSGTAAWQAKGTWTVSAVSQAVSVSPSSGSGMTQTFTMQYSDSAGAADLSTAMVVINTAAVNPNSCFVTYDHTRNVLYLLTDAGAVPSGTITPGNGSQQNSQCTLNGAGSSVTTAGNVLTLNVSLTFQVGYSGVKNVYLKAVSPYNVSGWQLRGTWTIPSQIQLVSVSPSSGAGAVQTFSMQYSDGAGATDISSASVLFNSTLTALWGCEVVYDRTKNTLALLTNLGAQPSGTITPGSGSQQNSQCTLNGAGSSVTTAGNVLTLNVSLAFLPAFSIATNIYMQAVNPSGTAAWQAKGTWTVSAVSQAVSVSPSSGSAMTQTFTMQYSDSAGAADLSTAIVVVNTSTANPNSCFVNYDHIRNVLYLLTDAGAVPAGTITPGSGSQQNSQCTLNGAGSSVTTAGNVLTLNVSLTFQAGFSGSKNVYLKAVSPYNVSGWQLRGTWTIPSQIQLVSVSPSSGAGAVQMFSMQYSDGAGATDISSVLVLFNSKLTASWGCEVVYDRTKNTLALLTDLGAQPTGTITPGSGSQQNSQCILSGAGSSVSLAGQVLTLNVALTFLPAFSIATNIYMQAVNPSGTAAWQAKGTWTVSAVSQAVSVSPSSGSGMTQTFTMQYSDSAGAADLSTAMVVINTAAVNPNGCFVTYDRTRNVLYLLTDSGAVPAGTITPGSGSQQNSQCTLNGAGSSVMTAGNILTLNVSLTFQAGFSGAKNVYLKAVSPYNISGWQLRGTWTVM